jgi:uncharacterized membrane protein YeaQ/YmgE (transglycosylase-associated protein family)
MDWIIIIIVGGILGWLASIVMRTDAQQGIFLNVIVGIIGALLGRFLAGVLGLGGGSITDNPLSLDQHPGFAPGCHHPARDHQPGASRPRP